MEEFNEVKEKEIKALREYIDALHATIDSLTNIVNNIPESDEPDYEDVEPPSAYVARKKR